MSSFKITPVARQDMHKILDHISQDNPEAAVRVVRQIRKKCESLGDHPHLGELRSEIGDGQYRSTTVGNYVIYYTAGEDLVQIVRVLHGARDHNSLL